MNMFTRAGGGVRESPRGCASSWQVQPMISRYVESPHARSGRINTRQVTEIIASAKN